MFSEQTQVNHVTQRLSDSLRKLRSKITKFVERHNKFIEAVESRYRASARNLLAYTALRQQDIRELQLELAQYGLSSLGRAESSVIYGLDQVLQRLSAIELQESSRKPEINSNSHQLNWRQAESLLHQHTYALLGPRPADRHNFIMVTAPDEVPSPDWFERLLKAGMNVLRINTAHGDLASWTQTVRIGREIASAIPCNLKIMFDFGGQKIRIAPFIDGPSILKLKPKKAHTGEVTENLRVTLLANDAAVPVSAEPKLVLPTDVFLRLAVGDRLDFADARGRERSLIVTEVTATHAIAEIGRTAYLSADTRICWQRQNHVMDQFAATDIPARELYAEFGIGDRFEIIFDTMQLSTPRRLVVPLANTNMLFIPGQTVSLDDGKVDAVIESVADNVLHCRVVRAARKKAKIHGNKGINFSADAMATAVLSEEDVAVLPQVLELADIIGISFIRSAADIATVHAILRNQSVKSIPGIVVKIETESAVDNLPGILLETMKQYPAGVMIARGDLATEIGFERLAEIQQEILWFCEAAHLPVIMATQVLENLTHTGIPSRAEVTDAAFATQAECVMLNKGEYIVETCSTLREIICKMEKHQYKKRSLFRALNISKGDIIRPTV